MKESPLENLAASSVQQLQPEPSPRGNNNNDAPAKKGGKKGKKDQGKEIALM